jgi:hypothetical protein
MYNHKTFKNYAQKSNNKKKGIKIKFKGIISSKILLN